MKLKEFQKYLLNTSTDVALFFNNDSNIWYFAGTRIFHGCLAVPCKGKPILFIPGFEAYRISKATQLKVVKTDKEFLETIHSHFAASKIGIIPSKVSYSLVKSIKKAWSAKLVNVENICKELRAVKTKDELKKTVKACAITDALFDEIASNLPSCKTETDAASLLKYYMTKLNLEASFEPIVASAANASFPHHIPSNSKLRGFTIIDLGIVYKNYCSDMTRTVFFGKPSSKDKQIYDNLLKVQNACVEKVTPGINLEDIDAFAKSKVGKNMMHRVGHSLGVEAHDFQPRPFTLKQGSILTIEPGTYYSNKFGIRIEDDVLVTDDGPIILTNTPKKLSVFSRKL